MEAADRLELLAAARRGIRELLATEQGKKRFGTKATCRVIEADHLEITSHRIGDMKPTVLQFVLGEELVAAE